MTIPNSTYRVLVEKFGDSDPTQFIGNEGEVFYDPNTAELKLSDGTTPGGITVGGGGTGGGGGGGESFWASSGVGIHTLSNVGIGTTNPQYKLHVIGDARVTGILTVGNSSITLDGESNAIYVGSGITISGDTGEIFVEGKPLVAIGTDSDFIVGILTATDINAQSIIADNAFFSGNVSIAGTLTYEDVTNVDSIGFVTARSGIYIGEPTSIGSTLTASGDAVFSGVVTATSFVGDGSGLTGLPSGSQWVTTTAGIHTLSNVGIGTTNPIQRFQVGAAGTSVVVIDSVGNVGLGTTNPNTKLHVSGDINLDDGGTFTTTVQCVTPTANRTISFPNETGTVALVAGSNGQLTYNSVGINSGITSVTFDGNLNISTRLINSLNAAASAPPESLTGTWFTGGTATTTKPQFIVEPSGATSTAWSTAGTGIGVNAASGFTGRLLDLQLNGTSRWHLTASGLQIFTQAVPATVNTTTTITIANIQTGIITSSTAAAVDMTLPTGTNMDGGFTGVYDGMAVMWSVVNVGPNNATLLNNTGHTVVGLSTVSSTTSGRFVSRRSAATTWVTYRIS